MEPHGRWKKPLIFRWFLILVLVLMFFGIGFGAYYLSVIGKFITVAMSQKVAVKNVSEIPAIPGQTNILLLGSDNDQKFTGNPLTQTMLIVHIDRAKNEMDMFSIPRDLWVQLPESTDFGKIDQAAEIDGIPSAIAVVEQTFGIRVDYYAWVGLYGFIKSIDVLGGINLQVVHPVLDNSYPTDINSADPYGYQLLDIQPGMQHMSGEEALQYVRSRHEDLIGDFGRTQRQRQLLLTMKDTFLNVKAIRNNFGKIPSILESLQGQIKTDITPAVMVQLGLFFLSHRNVTITQITLSPPTYATVGASVDGQSIVIANATASASLIKDIFGDQAAKITFDRLSNIGGIAR